jgi:hypothetical protein
MQHVFALLIACALFHSTLHARSLKITVSAGDHDRSDSVVFIELPDAARKLNQLRDSTGKSVPFQVDHRGRGAFIIQELKRGASADFILSAGQPAQAEGGVRVAPEKGRLKVTVDGKPVFHYQAEKSPLPRPDIKPIFQRGGYIHPVMSPGGKLVTDDYPPNHIHHHGIWYPWTKTVFEGRTPDFWNMGAGTGTVEFARLGEVWSGPVHGGFQAEHRFMDLTAPAPKTALNEMWEVTAYRVGVGTNPYWIFDLVSMQECATGSPLKLPKFHYGGLGFRGNWAWNGKEHTFFLTSHGETDRIKANETRGKWCHIGGKVDGELTGVAILCHPDNYRFPQPMRTHPTEPFFCFAPSQLGDWEITPDEKYISQYRFVVQDGAPDRDVLERFWNDYAHPPFVQTEWVK